MKLIYGILQIVDLVKHGDIHFYLIFFIWVWFVWLVKIIFARRYQEDKFKDEVDISTSIIIPTYNEIPEVFENALKSTVSENPDEIIVVLDGPNEVLRRIAESFNKVEVITIPKSGKRKAFAVGVEKSQGEAIILKDSDTIFTKGSLKEMIKPFIDPKVGGVTPDIKIFDPDKNWIRRITEWIHDHRSNITAPGQSSVNTVSCLPGPCAVFRRKPLIENLNEFLNEKFLGTRCETGDDRSLTNLILRQGYNTVFQRTSVVYTDSQNGLWAFIKQQLRWARSSQRNTLMSFRWMFKKPLFFAFHLITETITPFFLVAILIIAVLNVLFGLDKVTLIQGTIFGSLWFGVITTVVGINFSLGIRQIPHFRRKIKDIFWLPAYIFIVIIVILPVRVFGFFTMTNQGWMTRDVQELEKGIGERKGVELT